MKKTVSLAAPIRRTNGSILLRIAPERPPIYVTSAFPPATMQSRRNFEPLCLAAVAGAYHRIMECAGLPSAQEIKASDTVRNVEGYLKWLAGELEALATEAKLPDGFEAADLRLLEKHRDHIRYLRDNRADRLAALRHGFMTTCSSRMCWRATMAHWS